MGVTTAAGEISYGLWWSLQDCKFYMYTYSLGVALNEVIFLNQDFGFAILIVRKKNKMFNLRLELSRHQ